MLLCQTSTAIHRDEHDDQNKPLTLMDAQQATQGDLSL